MKANKLMLGDLIFEGGIIPHKVKHLGDRQIDGMSEDCYAPIPLTAEILEKNGFKQSGNDWRYYNEEDDG